MAKRVQRRRGTTAEHATFTGYIGESTVDTTKDTVVVHDGALAGGYPLAREDLSNVNLANRIGVAELNLVDGTVNQVIKTNGSGTISFGTIDVSSTAVGGDLTGTVGDAQIDANKVGITELNVTDGTVNQFLKTDGSGTLSFGTVVTDPTLTGDIGGTTSANVIGAGKVLESHLSTALKNFTVDEFVGASAQTTFTLTAAVGSVNALIAYIDGIVQPPTAYSLPTTTSIQFIVAPPVSSIIRCVHLGFQSTVGVPSDGTITTAKIAANAVTSAKILDGTIATADIANNAITNAKIFAQTITNASIAPGTIRNQELENLTILGGKIGANQIDGTKIALGADTQGDIMYYDGTNWVRLGPSTAGHVLTTAAANSNPYWAAGSSGTALPGVGSSGNVLTSDGSNWASAVVPVATTTVSGSVEIATQAEVTTGTDTARSITPATLAAATGAGTTSQGNLSTATQDMTHTTPAEISSYTLTGGEYTLGWQIKHANALPRRFQVNLMAAYIHDAPSFVSGGTPHGHGEGIFPFGYGTTFVSRLMLSNKDTDLITMRSRYITASPPYDIGDGHCHTFLFALVNNSTGLIETMSHSPDPCWAHNGPNCITPEYNRAGKGYRKIKTIDKTKGFEDPDRISLVEQEITCDFKNTDMALIPHPFQGTSLTGRTIILIDPCSDVALRAEEMKEAGEEASDELFYKDYVRYGNEHIEGRCTPCNHGTDEVMVVKPTWKNSN